MRLKLLLAVMLLAVGAFALERASQGRGTTGTRMIMLPNTTHKNCLKSVDVVVDAPATFRILDGGTTTFTVVLSSGSSYVRDWDDEDAPCNLAVNNYLEAYLSAGNYNLNTSTFTKK